MGNVRVSVACLVAMAGIVLSTSAQAGDERAAVLALVARLEGDVAHSGVTVEAVARAKEALERADRLRNLRDEAHARAADGLAREWAETGVDLARAADAEARAAGLTRNATDEQARLERARGLVEEGVARVGRLRVELEEAERARGQARMAPAPTTVGRGKK